MGKRNLNNNIQQQPSAARVGQGILINPKPSAGVAIHDSRNL